MILFGQSVKYKLVLRVYLDDYGNQISVSYIILVTI